MFRCPRRPMQRYRRVLHNIVSHVRRALHFEQNTLICRIGFARLRLAAVRARVSDRPCGTLNDCDMTDQLERVEMAWPPPSLRGCMVKEGGRGRGRQTIRCKNEVCFRAILGPTVNVGLWPTADPLCSQQTVSSLNANPRLLAVTVARTILC